MKPKIIELSKIYLAGVSFFGDPFQASSEWTEENEIGRLWSRFFEYLHSHKHPFQMVNKEEAFEVHIFHDKTEENGHYEIFIGMQTDVLDSIPFDLQVKVLPEGKYAVFTLKGEQIVSDWTKDMMFKWLPEAGYQGSQNFGFQLYDKRFKGMDKIAESTLDVYVPVKPIKE